MPSYATLQQKRYKFSIIWSLAVMLSYLAYSTEGVSENLWIVALEYFAVLGFFIWEVFQFRKRPIIF